MKYKAFFIIIGFSLKQPFWKVRVRLKVNFLQRFEKDQIMEDVIKKVKAFQLIRALCVLSAVICEM